MDYKTSSQHFQQFGLYQFRAANLSQRPQPHQVLPAYVPIPEQVTISPTSVNNSGPLIAHILTYPGANIANGVILFIHGGGFYMGYPEEGYAMLRIMAQYTGMVALCVEYHFAPEISLPQQVDECAAAYKYILETLRVNVNQIFVCGVSAGGGLALLMLQKLNSLKLPQPCGGILLSAVCDCSWKTALKTEQEDGIQDAMYPVVPNYREIYIDKEDQKEYAEAEEAGQDRIALLPKYSGLNGDWKGLCALYVSASLNEALINDSRLIVEKCKQFGVPYEFDFDPYLLHSTVVFADEIPEARDKLIVLIEWMKRQLLERTQ